MSQLLVSLLDEMQEQHPVPRAAVDDILNSFVNGNMSLDLELQGALAEKNSNFSFADLPTLKAVVASHISESQINLNKLGMPVTIQAGQIERSEFDLAMQTLQHDLDIWKVHLTRSKDRQAAIHFQLLQHRHKRLLAARDLAGKQITERLNFHVFSSWAGFFNLGA